MAAAIRGNSAAARAPSLRRWLIRGGFGVIAFLAVLLVASASYRLMVHFQDRAVIDRTPGKIVHVGRHALFVSCAGDPAHTTIMLENGMGVVSQGWTWVQRNLSDRYHVCAYDRAGTGMSRAVDEPVDSGTASEDLLALLDALGVHESVVLVGHSYGGLVARVFAARYPRRVRGMVLVDSSHEDMGERLPPQAQDGFRQLLQGFAKLRAINVFGGARLMGIADRFAKGLTADELIRARHLYSSVHHMAGAAREARGWERSAAMARQLEPLGALSLSVIVAGAWPEIMRPSWLQMQRELAARSSNSRFTVLQDADHFGLIHDAAFAEQVAREIALIAEGT